MTGGAELDIGRLTDWLAGNVEGFAGTPVVTRFAGGQSNPTYRLTTPARSYVLRRQPPGTLVQGAHAVDREARIMAALGTIGFPVPRIYALCSDAEVIGSAFCVMDMVEGRIFWDGRLPDIARDERPALYDAMCGTLAQLHSVDPQAIGLGDYGRHGGYLLRQIARWARQYQAGIPEAGRDLHMDRLCEWLPAHIPPGDETGIVHGDYRIDNMIFHPTEPRVIAVLDWELSTLGHPLADFAYHLMVWRMPRSLVSGMVDADFAALNLPDEQAYVAEYCRRTGRDGIGHLDYYIAFNLFRFAAILHGIKARLVRGTAASGHAAEMAAGMPLAAELAWRHTRSTRG